MTGQTGQRPEKSESTNVLGGALVALVVAAAGALMFIFPLARDVIAQGLYARPQFYALCLASALWLAMSRGIGLAIGRVPGLSPRAKEAARKLVPGVLILLVGLLGSGLLARAMGLTDTVGLLTYWAVMLVVIFILIAVSLCSWLRARSKGKAGSRDP